MNEQKAISLFGESIREIGILVTVFAPLDALFQKEAPSAPLVGALVTAGLIFVGLGIMIESEE